MLRRRLLECLALLLALAGVAVGFALASYDPADPSFSTATARPTTNLVGPVGAHAADLLLQGFGWAGAWPAMVLLAWAGRLALRHALPLVSWRAAAAVLAWPLLAAAVSLLPLPAERPASAGAGGVLGPLAATAASAVLAALLGAFGAWLGQAVALVLGLGLALLRPRPADAAVAGGGTRVRRGRCAPPAAAADGYGPG